MTKLMKHRRRNMKKILVVFVVLAAVVLLAAGVSMAVQRGVLNYSPNGMLGMAHLTMYNSVNFGPVCSNCHNGTFQPLPPTVTDPPADMKDKCCSECHPHGGKPDLFISHMTSTNPSVPSYCRCSDCHQISGGKEKDKDK
jgi:hypothetical protein